MSNGSPPLYCVNHPDIETNLRCNRCEKPICPKCTVLTPTGYRCKDCVRGQQKSFETARWYDYLLAFIISGILSYIGSRFVPYLGFFTIFLSPIAGIIISESIRFVIQRRRSKPLFKFTAIATAIGSFPMLVVYLVSTLGLISQGGFGTLWSLLWQAFYSFTVTSTVYYRLSGIKIGI